MVKYRTGKISVAFILLTILVLNTWGGFLKQIILQMFGGVLVTFLNIAICLYLLMFCQTKTKDKLIVNRKNEFLVFWVIFAVFYILIYILGWGELPVTSFAGLFVLPKQVYTMLFSAIFGLVFSVACLKLNEKEKKFMCTLFIVLFFAVAIANIIAVVQDPTLSKAESYTKNSSIFTLGYSLSYVLAIMIPVFLHLSMTRKNKGVYILLVIVSFVSLYYSAYFLALSAAVLSVVLFFVFRMKNKFLSRFLLVLVLGGFGIIVSTDLLQEILLYLADNIKIEFLSGRCREIAEFAAGGMDEAELGKTTYRFFIYKDTFMNFFDHPFLGNFLFGKYDCFYDHTTILDILACGGLLLFVPFVVMMRKGYKFVCSLVSTEAKSVVLVTFFVYLFISCFNVSIAHMYFGLLFMVVPMLLGGKKQDEGSDNSSL